MGMYSDPDYPDPANMAAANQAGVWADIEGAAVKKLIANAMKYGKSVTVNIPTFREGDMVLKRDESGKLVPDLREVTYDFAGISDADATREEMEFGAEAADFMAKSMLDVQQKYGTDFVKQRIEELKAADPTGYEIREMLGEAAKADLDRGYALAPGMRREVTEAEQAAQTARGNVLGSGAAAAEALSTGDAAWRMRQQRLANAASFLSGTTPVAQFGQISGAQQGASPFNPMGIQSGVGLNPNAGAQGQQFAMNSYNQQMNYAANQQPIGYQLLGMAAGGLGGAFGDYAANNWFGGKKTPTDGDGGGF